MATTSIAMGIGGAAAGERAAAGQAPADSAASPEGAREGDEAANNPDGKPGEDISDEERELFGSEDKFDRKKDRRFDEDRQDNYISSSDLAVTLEDFDAGSIVDLSGTARQADTLSLDLSDVDDTSRTLGDSLAARENAQHSEEASADMARVRRNDLMLSHISLDAALQKNHEAQHRLHQAIDTRSARLDRMAEGAKKAMANGRLNQPGLKERAADRATKALNTLSALKSYHSYSEMNVRNAGTQAYENVRLQGQARENERQHIANGSAAHQQAQALRHRLYQMGPQRQDTSRTDRSSSGLAHSVMQGLQEPSESPEQGQQEADARPVQQPNAQQQQAAAAGAAPPTAAPATGGDRVHAEAQAEGREEPASSSSTSSTGTTTLIDDGHGDKRLGSTFRMSTVGRRLVVDLAGLERPQIDAVA